MKEKVVLAYSGGLDTTVLIPVSYTHLDVYKRQLLLCEKSHTDAADHRR